MRSCWAMHDVQGVWQVMLRRMSANAQAACSSAHAPVCAFLHQQLLNPAPNDTRPSISDSESPEPDRLCLAEEAFQEPVLVDILKAAVKELSGDGAWGLQSDQ